MASENQVVQSPKKSLRLLVFRPGVVLAVLALLLLAGLVLYVVRIERGRSLPAVEVVYGQPLHAAHAMMMGDRMAAPPAPASAAGQAPRADLPVDYYDFGWVRADRSVEHTFLLANGGTQPLEVLGARTTCGCTTADLSAIVIPPGKAAAVVLRFDPALHDLHGQTVRRGLMIETNDPQSPLVEIWIQATIR